MESCTSSLTVYFNCNSIFFASVNHSLPSQSTGVLELSILM